ncbi:ABC transporter permease [Streptomyces ficellus]|uniref:ABC transporter permease n=1 Tax=Streptomyces ficellus TaxID=1977088 RepID=A0A6I6FK54_9ACTN|nr:ABC transporter permease [Streptomyces ficellus]QGV81817.1 ABC transporter permease [Streptomyces ficellus]
MPTSPNRRTLAVVVLVPVLAALALWAFAWPAARVAPRDLPVGVAGPAAATAQLQERFARAGEGSFDVHRYPDETAARAAIEDRDVYGAVVASPGGPKVLTATAASPVVAQLLQHALPSAPVTDVVAAPPGDPRGTALAASLLPLALAGVAAGALVTLTGLRGARAVTALLGAALLVGVVGAAIGGSWLGVITGGWGTTAGVLALTTLAVGGTVAGLAALLGRAGIGLGALVIVLLGNPFSGVAGAPELLPAPAGAIGQLLPPGAAGSLLRSVAFFDGAAAAGPLTVLVTWAVLGLTAVLAGARHTRATAPTATRHRPAAPAPAG